jgi:hypothetical protein
MIAGMVFAWAYQGPDILVDRDAKFFGVLMSDGKLSVSGRRGIFSRNNGCGETDMANIRLGRGTGEVKMAGLLVMVLGVPTVSRAY